MREKIGGSPRGQFEEVWVSILEEPGEKWVELRVYGQPLQGGVEWIPRRESIRVPAAALPDLLQVLQRTERVLAEEGWLQAPRRPAPVRRDEIPVSVRGASPPGTRDARRHPRFALRLRVECRPLGAATAAAGAVVSGESADFSLGGAQVWLSVRLPRYSFVKVSAQIKGEPFSARGEVVGIASVPRTVARKPVYRHGLRWLSLGAAEKALLARALQSGDT